MTYARFVLLYLLGMLALGGALHVYRQVRDDQELRRAMRRAVCEITMTGNTTMTSPEARDYCAKVWP